MIETRWWWVRHAPVPDGGRIYGQKDLPCDCSDAPVFTAVAAMLPRDAVWVTSHLQRTTQTAAAIIAASIGAMSPLSTSAGSQPGPTEPSRPFVAVWGQKGVKLGVPWGPN